MKKKALFLDLDNTIYPVHAIGERLFAPLFDLLEKEANLDSNLQKVKDEVMRRPFQKVAEDYHINPKITEKATNILKDLEYNDPIQPFTDFSYIVNLRMDKFLITTGFRRMQESKVRMMKLQSIFNRVYIIDPMVTETEKKDVFLDIIERYKLDKSDVLIIGDDLESEIKAAKELGVEGILYDKLNNYPNVTDVPRIVDFTELSKYLE